MKSDTHAAKERAFADAAHHERRLYHARMVLKRASSLCGWYSALRQACYYRQRRDAMQRKYMRLVREVLPKWY